MIYQCYYSVVQLAKLSIGFDEGQCHKIHLSISGFFQLGWFLIAEVLGILSTVTFPELQPLTSQWPRNIFFDNDLALYLDIPEQLHLLQIFVELFYSAEVQEWIHQFQIVHPDPFVNQLMIEDSHSVQ